MSDVELSVDRGIATVLLNRPESLNALSSGVLSELDAVIAQIEKSDEIAGVIVTGAGRAFVAGADIEEISNLDPTAGLRFTERGQAVFSRIERLDKPVVAAVNGFALGGGCELAMACHIRVASTKARFGQPEVKLGILPGFGGTQRLPRLVGRGLATQLILSGEMIAADEALRTGLVNEVVEPDALLPRAEEIARKLAANGPLAVRKIKEAVLRTSGLPLDEAYAVENECAAVVMQSKDAREGPRAFMEKREPVFTGE